MRRLLPSLAVSAILISTLSGPMLLAQAADQNPAPGQQQSQAQAPNASQNQAPPPPDLRTPNPKRQARFMAKKLGLNPDQQTQLEPILANRDQQIEAIRTDTSLAPRDRRTKVEAVRADTVSKIQALLTPAQQQQFVQMQQNQQARHQQGQQAPPPPPGN